MKGKEENMKLWNWFLHPQEMMGWSRFTNPEPLADEYV
jgi:hypothetical protein